MTTKIQKSRVLRLTMRTEKSKTPLNAVPQVQEQRSAMPLEIYELLEHVLSHLPMRDLLLSQIICKRWRNVIASSKRLQRQLYLLMEPLPQTSHVAHIPNPLLTHAFRGHFHYESRFVHHRDHLKPIHKAIIPETLPFGAQYLITLDSNNAGWDERITRPEASWRNMMLTRPAVTSVGILDRRVAPDWDDVWVEKGVENDKGVTLGMLLRFEDI